MVYSFNFTMIRSLTLIASMSYQRLKLEKVTLMKPLTSMSYQRLKLENVTLMKLMSYQRLKLEKVTLMTSMSYQRLKLEKVTLEPAMLHSPQQPVIPSNQSMLIPLPPQREAEKTMPS